MDQMILKCILIISFFLIVCSKSIAQYSEYPESLSKDNIDSKNVNKAKKFEGIIEFGPTIDFYNSRKKYAGANLGIGIRHLSRDRAYDLSILGYAYIAESNFTKGYIMAIGLSPRVYFKRDKRDFFTSIKVGIGLRSTKGNRLVHLAYDIGLELNKYVNVVAKTDYIYQRNSQDSFSFGIGVYFKGGEVVFPMVGLIGLAGLATYSAISRSK